MTVIDLLAGDPRKRTGAVRHPEKAARPDAVSPPKPPWLRVRAPGSASWRATDAILAKQGLTTVCREAACPNIGEGW
ncbi:MAG: lipoyl synthase, partial [Methylocystis sp.]|nr:lipoyl synthase [Methylocystis sp.]